MGKYGVSRCKSCGKEIIWIKTSGGKNMPCDANGIPYRENKEGSMILVTQEGKTVRATEDREAKQIGFTSHFATCPNANGWRR